MIKESKIGTACQETEKISKDELVSFKTDGREQKKKFSVYQLKCSIITIQEY